VASLKDARAAKTKAARMLAGRSRLQGIGITKQANGYGIKVNLLDYDDALPAEIDGVPVRVEVVGPIRAR
jgi:hypothetical protein